jgi:hypothetical protein
VAQERELLQLKDHGYDADNQLRRSLLRSRQLSSTLAKASAKNVVAYAACGTEYCGEFLDALVTLAGQQRLENPPARSFDVYAIVDSECGLMLNASSILGSVRTILNFTILPIEQITQIVGNADLDMFGRCSSLRLYMPEIFAATYNAMLYLDSDTLVAGSLAPLFSQMESNSQSSLFMAEAVVNTNCNVSGLSCGLYVDCENLAELKAGPTGYNSGLLGINIDAWTRRGISQRVLGVMEEREAHKEGWLRFGDQDVLNLLARRDPSLLTPVPCEYNLRTDSLCKDRAPVIVHGSRHEFGNHWKTARTKLVDAASRILTQGNRASDGLPTTLWTFAKMHLMSDLPRWLCKAGGCPGRDCSWSTQSLVLQSWVN